MTSFRIDATRSLSYSHAIPIDPRETFIGLTVCGTRFESGEILHSFCGNAKRPEDKKSKWGIKTNFGCYSLLDFMNLPTSGKSTH